MKDAEFIAGDRRGSDSVKWGVYGEDVLPLWVADMDFTSPQEVIEALKKRIEHGVFGYALDSRPLKDAVIHRMKALHKWEISQDDILLLPGVVSGFNLVCQALAAPGESILIQPPVYPPFFKAPECAGAKTLTCDLVKGMNGTYQVDYTAFERTIEKDTRVFILCNPHNPVGRVYRKDELTKMSEICLEHGVVICSDEIHCDLVFSGHEHIPIATLGLEVAENTVTLIAPSKTYNIAGLDCSILICTNLELRKKLVQARRGILGSVNLLGQVAALAAYEHGEPWLKEVMTYLESNRDYLLDFVDENLPGIRMVKPEATYLAWLDCRGLALGESPFQFFLKNARVAMNEGLEFGETGRDFVRLNFGCSRQTLADALTRMKRALETR